MIPEWIWLVIILSSAGMTIRNSDIWLERHDLGKRWIVTMLLFDFVMSSFLSAFLVSLLYTDSLKYFLYILLFAFLQVLAYPTWRALSRRVNLSDESTDDCISLRKREALIDVVLSVPYGLFSTVVFTLLATKIFILTAEFSLSIFNVSDNRIIYAIIIGSVVMTIISKVAWKNTVLSCLFLIPVILCIAILSKLGIVSDYFLPLALFVYLGVLTIFITVDSFRLRYRRHEQTEGTNDEEAQST